MAAVAGIAAQFVAPMVANIAGGLIQNVAGGLLSKLPGIGDAFQKIAGGVGGVLGGLQGVFGGIGQLGQIAGRGLFPPMPLGVGGIPLPGCFGPRWGNVNVNVSINVQGQLPNLMGPGSPLMRRLDQTLGNVQQALDQIGKLLGGLGGVAQQGGSFLEQIGNILKQLTGGAQAVGPESPKQAESTGGGGGVSSTGGGGSSSGGSAPLGEKALNSAFDTLGSIESEIENLDMNSKDAPKKLMQLQAKMQKVQQMIQQINEMRKAMHDASMNVIRNFR